MQFCLFNYTDILHIMEITLIKVIVFIISSLSSPFKYNGQPESFEIYNIVTIKTYIYREKN